MSHLCDCEYCEYDEYYDEGVITQPEKPADYAEVTGGAHRITEEQMRAELDAHYAQGSRITHFDISELYAGVTVPRRPSWKRRLSHRWYGLRESLAAHLCPWDIYGRDA